MVIVTKSEVQSQPRVEAPIVLEKSGEARLSVTQIGDAELLTEIYQRARSRESVSSEGLVADIVQNLARVFAAEFERMFAELQRHLISDLRVLQAHVGICVVAFGRDAVANDNRARHNRLARRRNRVRVGRAKFVQKIAVDNVIIVKLDAERLGFAQCRRARLNRLHGLRQKRDAVVRVRVRVAVRIQTKARRVVFGETMVNLKKS